MVNQQKLPVITIVARDGSNGVIDKNSVILLDGKILTGLRDFSFNIEGDDETGIPRVNLSLAAFVQVVQEAPKKETADEST